MGYLAAAQLSWDLTADFVREREVFGKPLAAMQNTQFKMAELRAELDIAQCFVDQAALAFNAGTLSAEDAAAAKLKTSDCSSAWPTRVCSYTVAPDLWMSIPSVVNRPMRKLPPFTQAVRKL